MQHSCKLHNGETRCNINDPESGEKTPGERVLQLINPQGMLGGFLVGG